jgi:hypothetical protein
MQPKKITTGLFLRVPTPSKDERGVLYFICLSYYIIVFFTAMDMWMHASTVCLLSLTSLLFRADGMNFR